MRNKWLMSLFIVILALPFFSGATYAADANQFADGTYEITAKALNADTGEPSLAAPFIDEEATLKVQDGEATLIITVPKNPEAGVTGLQIEGKQPGDIKEDAKATYMEFILENVSAELNARVQYEVPAINLKHDVPLKFALVGLDNIPTADEAQPEEPVEEPAEEEATEEEVVEEPAEEEAVEEEQPVENVNPALVPDEAFTLNFVSDSPAVNNFFLNPVALLYKNGEAYIQINGTGGQFIKSLTINGEEVTWGKKNEDGTFTFQFKVDDASLSTVLDFGMVIDARGTVMEHVENLAFDASTQAAADVENYTLLVENNDVEVPSEEPTEEENNKPEEPVKEENKETATPEVNPLAPDKAYEIDFTFKHETEDKTSAADSFFVKPAILLEKDGVRYLQITASGSQYIDSLKNKFGEFIIVGKNADGSVTYQFKLDGSISDAMLIDMVISVPGFYEEQAHKARLVLDESSMKEVDASAYQLAAAQNGNGPTADGKSGNDFIPAKPELGGSDNKENVKNAVKTGGKVTNPQTGDTTNIMLLVLLLIGSAIPLAVQLKRRIA